MNAHGKITWKERTERFPHGLITPLASGENPPGVPFELLIGLGGGTLYVKREGRTWSASARDVMDSFFDQFLDAEGEGQ